MASSASTGCFTQLLLPQSSASYTGLPAYLIVHQRTSCILPHHTSFMACAPPRRSSVLISLGRTFRLWLSTYIIHCEALLPSEPANQRISDPVTRSSVATHDTPSYLNVLRPTLDWSAILPQPSSSYTR